MTNPDLSGRRPTVQRAPAFPWPRWRPASRTKTRTSPLARDPRDAEAQPPREPATPSPTVPRVPGQRRRPQPKETPAQPATGTLVRRTTVFEWLLREGVALAGMAGAALTVLAQLAWVMPLSRPYRDVLGWWMTQTSNFWLSHYDQLGVYPHSHVQAALALAVFLAMIGLGARISAVWTGTPLDRRWGFLDGQTWPSLTIMAVLAVIFLLGHDPNPSGTSYDGFGGKNTVAYLFAIILMLGYAAGDFLGQRGFHIRLYRLAALLIVAVAVNQWLLANP